MNKDIERVKIGKQKKVHFYHYLNFTRFKKKIEEYGYQYSLKKYLTHYLITILGFMAASLLFRLDVICIAIILIVVTLFFPTIILSQFKYLYEQERFRCSVEYMEEFIHAFKRKSKILSTLKDLYLIVDEKMRKSIQNAIIYIENGAYENNLYEEALSYIEYEYGSERMKGIHNFAVVVETQGGDSLQVMDLLMGDLLRWKNRTYEEKSQKKDRKRTVTISALASVGICVLMQTALPDDMKTITNSFAYQIATCIFVCLQYGIYVLAQILSEESWLVKQNFSKEEHVLKDYDTALHYDMAGARKKVIVLEVIPFIGVIYAAVSRNILVAIVAALVAYIIYTQPERTVSISLKRTLREINKSFPYWLRNLILHLQTENVNMSIRNSRENCPVVLRHDMDEFLEESQETPNSIYPYENFLSEFNVPEVHAAFRSLYALNAYGSVDVQSQMKTMIEQNDLLMDRAEELEKNDATLQLTILSLLPMILGSAELLVCMFLLMMSFVARTLQ